jgi:hypothetical protein
MNSKTPFLQSIILFFIIGIASLFIYACSGINQNPTDVSTAVPTQPISLTATAPTQSVNNNAQPAVLETRRLTLEYPPKIKADTASDIVRLTLEVDDLGNITPTAFYQENALTGEVIQIPNLYGTHNVGIETTFDIAGVEVKPAGSTYQPMRQGQPVTFFWSIRANQVGNFKGTIWVYLVLVDKVSGEESRLPISAQIIEIEAVDFFGFSTNLVKTSGVVGSVLGVIVGFPFFDDFVKYLWAKRRKKKKTERK